MTLVILAAGMGSRYGGLKQIDPISAEGEFIIDFSVYDAISAGFDKVVFVIKRENLELFRDTIGKRFEDRIKVEYAFQDLCDIPEGAKVPEGRVKPWGTAHALLAARDLVNEPFMVINSDDFYGRSAYKMLFDHFASLDNTAKYKYAMVGYVLENTLTENGTVSRGVCETKDGYLEKVTEVTKIASDGSCVFGGEETTLPGSTPVSMNLWGLTPDIFDILKEEYAYFLANADLMKDEFFIPSVISKAVDTGKATVKVFENTDKWYGITYREDLQEVKDAIGGYINDGLYEGI